MNIKGPEEKSAIRLRTFFWFKNFPVVDMIHLLQVLSQKKWDKIIIVYPFPIILEIAIIFCRIKKISALCIYVDDIVMKGILNIITGIYETFFSKLTSKFFSKISVMSQTYAEQSRGLKNVQVPMIEIPPIVEYKKTIFDKKVCKKKIGYSETNRIYIFVGGLRHRLKYKRLDLVIQAWSNTFSETDHLLIIGGGDLENHYRQLAESAGARNCHFLGYVNDDILRDIYKAADILLIASDNNNEAFGLVCIEAMMFGCKIIATEIAGFKGSIGKEKLKDVQFIEPGSAKAIEKAVYNMNKASLNQKSESNISYVRKNFSEKTTTKAVQNFLY